MADPQSYNRGRNYQLSGAVSHGVRTASGLKARVEGNYSPYYKVTITLTDSDDLMGNCTCPVGNGCKHCVAVCLEWLAHPNNFSQDGSVKGGVHSPKKPEQTESGEKNQLTGIDVNTIINPWTTGELKKNFLALWSFVAPKAHGNLIPNDLPKITWLSTLDSIDDGSGESWEKDAVGYAVDYSNELIIADDPHPSFLQPNRNATLVGRWFSPPELMHFFPDPATKKALLIGWIDSYCELGTQVRDAFAERGIIPPNAETLVEFYTEIFGEEWEREHEQSGRSDYGWHRYDDYEDEFDPDNVFIDDLYPLANRFIKRITPLLRELAEYYCALKQYGLNEEAQRFLTSALVWFVSEQDPILTKIETKVESREVGDDSDEDEGDNQKEDGNDLDFVDDDEGDDLDDEKETDSDIDKVSLPDLETIRVEIQGLLESAGLQNVTPQERVDYYLKLLMRNLNPGNAELIRKAVGQSDDPRKIGEYAIQKLKPMFEKKPHIILWTIMEQIVEEYLPKDVPTFLQLAVQHLRQYPDPRTLLHSITSHLGSQSPPFIRDMQDAILNQLLTQVKKGKKQGEPYTLSDLYVQAVNWFVQYYQTQQNFEEAIVLLVQFARNKPKQVDYGHYKVVKKLVNGMNTEASVEALHTFVSNVEVRGEPTEIALMLIDERLLDPACAALARVKDARTEWKILQKLTPKINQKTTLSDESFQTLISQLLSLIRQWIRPDARSRPDRDIADAAAFLKSLHELQGAQDKWEKWFAGFFRDHSRKHNLRAALKEKGLI